MSLAKYEVFSTVVEMGSLTKAAESLNLTQSAVSYSIANLESELGFPLLIRSRSGITLTSNGHSILKSIRNVLHWNEKLKQQAASINGLEVGTIRIGAITSVCIQWLPGLMKNFKQEFPLIEIKIFQGGYQDIEEWITNGVIDFGFITLPTMQSFETIPLKKDRILCILPHNHPLGNQDKIRLEQLENESFITLKSGYNHDIKRILKESGVTLKNRFEMTDDQAIIAMVENELGVSTIPELVLQGMPHKVRVLNLEPEQHRIIGIGATSLKEISPATKKFIEYVKKLLGSNLV
ncbi:LysR family transcriptional regulator [Peribacillus simplex]|uniref:LysR family transcriptional regulator n=1 Tax=Peribacillus simplex TaxID=1478 RepID=UPI001E1187F3|nr:LysR family transcriptional regulator [Peribacillus simplex]MED3987300.1 LysR family transcriptional regulator [Peribacillus simplex]MED4094088.1 LysR family transcriptional regulator [Peribacillus simplex]CAH0221730.1 HTH-type transcriptional regulator GltC [Peribacillus simplex]